MLIHIGQGDIAAIIENAWKKTLEDGVHTPDIYNEKNSSKKVGTKEFAEEVVKRLWQKPSKLKIADYKAGKKAGSKVVEYKIDTSEKKTLVGVDIFVDMHTASAKKIADKIKALGGSSVLELKTIASKGLILWPRDEEHLMESDHWCCRFMPEKGGINHKDIAELLEKMSKAGIDFIKVENLYEFNGKRGYSLAQGE